VKQFGRFNDALLNVRRLLSKSAKRQPTHEYHIQLIRSFIVSIVAVIGNFGGSFILKDKLHVFYLLSAAGSFVLGLIINYVLSVKWVFASRKLESRHTEFLIFSAILGSGLVLNLINIAAMVELAHLNYWAALSISTVVVFFWNFLARKKFLY